MRRFLPGLAFIFFATLALEAAAQTYPTRPVTMIVPYPPGGPTETLGRIFAERFRASLGQPVILENIAGAAGTIGTTRAARAAPDGYTINFSNVASHVFASIVYTNLKYDILKDLEPIALLTISPLWLVAGSGVPAKDLPGLVAWLKANPDKGTFGIVGPGSPAHLCGVHFQNLTGTNITFVPYRGAGPVIQDLMGGQISLACLEATATRPTVESGKIRALALLAKNRWQPMPNVPTADEGGVKGLYLPFWHGLWAPKGTPAPILARLNAVAMEALADPAMRERLIKIGVELPPREQQTPEALRAFHTAEFERWRPIIEAAKIKPE
jgi:tripartite-type tricarboxylate transporter receptor subunit TctC